MRIAVLQHLLRADADADADALIVSATRAAEAGADIVIVPEVPSVHAGPLLDEWWQRVAVALPHANVLVPHVGPDTGSVAFAADFERFGHVAMLAGDAAIDPRVLEMTAERDTDVVVLAPRSESDLQAEALLELAIALSLSVAPLVIVVETDGAEPGSPGHGGSAIVYLGQVMAEAGSGDDILLHDVDMPLVGPEPPQSLPEPAPILAQRLATHGGRKLDVSYFADLT